jgi:hypothetical protein
MILLINTFLTDTVIIKDQIYPRGLLPTDDKIDIFKYTLASFKDICRWHKVLIYCKIDECYKHREEELQNYIKEIFNDVQLESYKYRLEYQKDWQSIYDKLDDNFIWFFCNHDHIFLSKTEVMQHYLNILEDFRDQIVTLPFSHWPEWLELAKIHNASKHDTYLKFVHPNNVDSIKIITKKAFEKWWMTDNYGDKYLPRTDYWKTGNAGHVTPSPQLTILPLTELCRHYDGYGHLNCHIHFNTCPPLRIPPGFFCDNIKIRYGYDNNIDGWVNINPIKNDYITVNNNGTEYKWILNDIPEFWKSHISIIDSNPNIDNNLFNECRKQGVLQHANAKTKIDEDIQKSIYDYIN